MSTKAREQFAAETKAAAESFTKLFVNAAVLFYFRLARDPAFQPTNAQQSAADALLAQAPWTAAIFG